jgi:hypothetical protein
MKDKAFKINLVNKYPKVDIEKIFKWMQENGEDFIDYYFDRECKQFPDYVVAKHPEVKENLVEYIAQKEGAYKRLKIAYRPSFLDMLSFYEETFEEGEPWRMFYQDMVDYVSTDHELNTELHNILKVLDNKEDE